MSTNAFKKHVDLLLIEEKDKKHYVPIKDFTTFMYDHALHHGSFVVVCKLLAQKNIKISY